MALLAIDTSSPIASLSIRRDDGSVVSVKASHPNSHIETLSLLLQQLLDCSSVKIQEINSIIIGSGPGSFTGLRIGYSYVAGLAMALQIPVIEVSSLQAAINLNLKTSLQVSLVDARRGEYFVGIYQCQENTLESLVDEQIMTLVYLETILLQKLAKLDLKSSNLKVYSSEPVILLNQINSVESACLSENLIKLSALNQTLQKHFSVEEIANLTPNYLRKVAAVKLNEPRINQ